MAKKKHKWKYRVNIKKKIIVLVILGVSLFVGLGYSILGNNLGINGLLELAGLSKKTAEFDVGTTVQSKMNALVGTVDGASNATALLKSTIEPTSENKTAEHIVSSSNSNHPIYMWWDEDNQVMYYWTVADKIYFNADSSYFFYNYWSMHTIEGLEDMDTSNVTNMSYMFNGCSALTSLDLSNWDTSKVTNFEAMFNVYELTSLDISGWDLSNWNTDNWTDGDAQDKTLFPQGYQLTEINLTNVKLPPNSSYFFYSLSNLQQLIGITTVDASNVINMSQMFSGIYGFTSLDLSGWDTSNVTNFSKTFSGIETDELNISGWDLSNRNYNGNSDENIFGTMYDCAYIKKLIVNNIKMPSNSEYLFAEIAVLTEIVGLNTINTSNVTNFRYIFHNLSCIKELNISNWDLSNWNRDYDYMFSSNGDLEKIYASNIKLPSNSSGLFSQEMTSAENTKIEGIETFDTSIVVNMDWLFGGARLDSDTGSIDLSNWDVSNVTNMDELLSSCDNTEVNISGWDLSNINTEGFISNIFNHNMNITTINVTNIKLPADSSYFFHRWNYYDSHNITTIIGLNTIDTSNVTNMSYMFDGGLYETLDISNWNTSNVTDMSYMFNGCQNLRTIYATNSFVTTNVQNDTGMFGYSTLLVGKLGTAYDENHINREYARIDNAPTAPGYFSIKEGWFLVTNKYPMSNQASEYYRDGVRIESGWHNLPDFSGNINTYYFRNGRTVHGWLELDGKKYYLSTFDDDGNGYIDGRRLNGETREIDGVSYNFDANGVCTNCN